MKKKIWMIPLGVLAVIGSYTLFANGKKQSNNFLDQVKMPIIKTAYTESAATPVDFEKAVTAAVPSIVHIKTMTKFKQVSGRQMPGESQNPFGGMFGDDFFKRFFGDGNGSMQVPDQRASGSGVIISSDGYIVTNNHVVNGAQNHRNHEQQKKLYCESYWYRS